MRSLAELFVGAVLQSILITKLRERITGPGAAEVRSSFLHIGQARR
jgi:hypothetical protein